MGGLSSSIGSLATGLSTVNQAVGLVNSFSGSEERQEQSQALLNLQQQQALSEQQTAQNNAIQKEKAALESTAAEATRQRALKNAVARQRAQFGSSGIGNASSGSQEAVLLGLFSESEEERVERGRIDGLLNQTLDLKLENQKSSNLLQQEQLRQRQNLSRATSVSDALDFGVGISRLF